jgi:BlaI family transcriptional regulator, penicillinase repressor
MEAIYARKSASAFEVRAAMPDPPSYSAVRATLQVLVEKGLLAHTREGRRYLYKPTIPHGEARQSALRHLIDTYFDGSASAAMAALIPADQGNLTEEEYRALRAIIEKMEKEDEPP